MTIIFMWKVIPIFGGSGPRFYQFEDSHGCGDSWWWHLLFLNNIIPWTQTSKCLEQTWYLANDLQFFAILCGLTILYKKNRKRYYIAMGVTVIVALIIQLITISTNDLQASFLASDDEYWTVYYYKPYTRIHGYLIGVYFGCEYFRFKYIYLSPPNTDNAREDENGDSVVHKTRMDNLFDTIR